MTYPGFEPVSIDINLNLLAENTANVMNIYDNLSGWSTVVSRTFNTELNKR
jgi:hypothetical protein